MRPSLAAALVLLAAAPAVPAPATLDELGPVAPGMVRVVLVRHAQALSNLDPAPKLPPEKLDHLTDLGRSQARTAAQALRDRGVAVVLSSPAHRALETAKEIGSVLGREARMENGLRPLDLGRSPTGQPLGWDERIAEWKAGRDPAPPGGESLEQLGRRLAALVSSLRAGHSGKTVVLVTHSEVIGAYLGLLRGTPGVGSYPPRVANGSLSVVDLPVEGPAQVRLSGLVPAPVLAAP